jgi:DNA end-binding protein Ku
VQEKLKGRKIIASTEESRPKGSNVVDLMEALRKSVRGEGSPKAGAKPKALKPTKKKSA